MKYNSLTANTWGVVLRAPTLRTTRHQPGERGDGWMNKQQAESLLGCIGVPLVVAFALWAFWPSDDSRNTASADAETQIIGPTLPPPNRGDQFAVPSDGAAVHWLLEWQPMPNGHREALSRRDGTNSGTIFARVEIDCDLPQYRPLGEGDTVQEAQQTHSSLGGMEDIVPGSIQYWKRLHVCAQPLRRNG